MLYHFTFGSFIHKFKVVEEKGYRVAHWWEYLCSTIIFMIGYIFMSAATMEFIEFNKNLGLIKIRRITIGWSRSSKTYFMSDISDIKVVKRGLRTRYNDTIHYMV